MNCSNILKSAWANYRANSSLLCDKGLAFSRRRFALALRLAWANAKLVAFYAQQEAARAVQAVAAPTLATVRNELLDLQTKDHWSTRDFARQSELYAALAA